jgi:hypothetical protein
LTRSASVAAVLAALAASGCTPGPLTPPALSADASTCQTVPPAEAPAPECNNVQNVASWIRPILHSGDGALEGPPAQLTDGIYRATKLDGYIGATSPNDVRDTVAVTQGGTVLLWTSELFNATTGATMTVTGTATATGPTAGPTFVASCGTVTFAPFNVEESTPQSFWVASVPPRNGLPIYVETFTLTDCAPGD